MLKKYINIIKYTILTLFIIINFTACKNNIIITNPQTSQNDQFGIDININMDTIDNYLNLDNVVYRDVRMLYDPANFEEIGGEADLTSTIEGFKIVPYPYIATLQDLPVSNGYKDNSLYDVEWSNDGKILSAIANYEESLLVLSDLFPKDKKIFIMCGGGGYANMMKLLLINLGWDENNLYNIGGNWSYKGKNKKELVLMPEKYDGNKIYASWRADYAYIDFDKLHPIN